MEFKGFRPRMNLEWQIPEFGPKYMRDAEMMLINNERRKAMTNPPEWWLGTVHLYSGCLEPVRSWSCGGWSGEDEKLMAAYEWMLLTQQILRKPHVMWAVISGIFSHLPQFGSVFSRHPTSHNFFRAVGCSLNSNPLIILFAFTILSPDYILICFAPNDIFFSLTTIPTCNAKYPNINSHAVITSVLLPNFCKFWLV